MTRSAKTWLVLGTAGLMLLLLGVASFVSGMSPLAALSSPFSWFISVREVPERLRLRASVDRIDPEQLSKTLRALAASQGLTTDADGVDPRNPSFYETQLANGKGGSLILMKTGGQYVLQIFQNSGSEDSLKPLIDATAKAFSALGFKNDTIRRVPG